MERMYHPTSMQRIYHTVHDNEGWEASAHMIINLINYTGRQHPAQPRMLILQILGHHTNGIMDHDMYILQHQIILELLSPWLAQVDMPLMHYRTSPDILHGDHGLPLTLDSNTMRIQSNGEPIPTVPYALLLQQKEDNAATETGMKETKLWAWNGLPVMTP